MKDSEIIKLIVEGRTTKAFELIYKNFPMIRKMIIASGGNSDDAKDVFQDAVLVLYRMFQRNDFVLTSSISTLLFSISKKIWYKRVRDDLAHSKKVQLEEESNSVSYVFMDEFINENEKASVAEKVLNELGEPCKSLLVKFYYEKQSMKEISEEMKYSNEKTAKAQKYKCIERGKKLLKEKWNSITMHLL